MTDRERLIELVWNSIANRLGTVFRENVEDIADDLLANGVIVPPCKVGDMVWFNTFKKNATVCVGVQPHKVDRIDVELVCGEKELIPTKIPYWMVGERVFLTKEEAEQALKERERQ